MLRPGASQTKSLAVTTRGSASRSSGRRRLENRQHTRLAQACQLLLTECIEVGGHGRVDCTRNSYCRWPRKRLRFRHENPHRALVRFIPHSSRYCSPPAANKNRCAKSTGPRRRWRAIPRWKSSPPTKPRASSPCAIPPRAPCTRCTREELIAAPLPPKLCQRNPARRSRSGDHRDCRGDSPRRRSKPAATKLPKPSAAVRGSGEPLAEGPGYSISRGERRTPRRTTTIEGPGYSITREAHAPPGRVTPERRGRRLQCRKTHRPHHLPGRSPHAHRRRDHRVHG